METSALTGENVQEAFSLLVKNIKNKIEDGTFLDNEIRPVNFNSQLTEKPAKKTYCIGCSRAS